MWNRCSSIFSDSSSGLGHTTGTRAGFGAIEVRRRFTDGDGDGDDDDHQQLEAVYCAFPVPGATRSVGSHETEQNQHHDHPQHPNGEPLIVPVVADNFGFRVVDIVVHTGEDEGQNYDHERPCERVGVAEEEDQVPRVVGVPDDGVASDVTASRVLPDGPRRAEPGGVRRSGHQQEQQ